MRVRVLDESDADRVRWLCALAPVDHCYVASRLDAGVLTRGSPGELWGYPADAPRSLLHVGTTCVPVATDAEARAAFVERLGRHRPFVSIVGPADEALALFEALGDRWGQPYGAARLVRRCQPVMVARTPAPLASDPRLEQMTMRWFDSYFDGAVAMYTEELGESPLGTNPHGYRSYVARLIESGRAYGIVQEGRVVFKADIGAVAGGVAQVQGVWVHPDLRGRGLAAPAMAGVTNLVVARGLVASLYVNDFNAPALATYRRCGYQQVGTFASVLY